MPVDYNILKNVNSVGDFQRLQQEFDLKKQLAAADLHKAQSGGNLPAAIQIANEIQKRRAAGDTEGATLLENSAKIYDKGLQYDPQTGGYVDMRGYGAALGNLKYGENLGGETATQQVRSAYEPGRAEDIATRQAQVELTYGPITAAEEKKAVNKAGGIITPVDEQQQSRDQVSKMLSDMRSDFLKLSEKNAIVDDTGKAMDNLGRSIGASGVGRFYGKVTGDPAETIRKQIDDSKPKLLLAIMRAGGASARGLDSDAELKQWLLTTGDATSSIQSNLALMNRLENIIGQGAAQNTDMDPLEASRAAVQNSVNQGFDNPNLTLPEQLQTEFDNKKKPRLKFNPQTGEFE